jgi:signal transduction histidine kinase
LQSTLAPAVIFAELQGASVNASVLEPGEPDRQSRLSQLNSQLNDLLATVSSSLRPHSVSVYRRLGQIVGAHIGATFCRFLTEEADALTLQGSAGPRPGPAPRRATIRLSALSPYLETVERGKTVVIRFARDGGASPGQFAWLFSPAARTGFIVPFSAGKQRWGLLVVAEERQSRGEPQVEALEFVARRVGEILGKEHSVVGRRREERRRARNRVVLAERKRLSRDLHDAVGQSLNALLMQIRVASARGEAGVADLRLLEITTQHALDGARALAYNLRGPESDPLGEARRLVEQTFASSGCSLAWTDERTDLQIGGRVARELSAVIKESVTNIARHAHADRALVRLESPNGSIRITIQDNGVGFVPDSVGLTEDGRGLGLIGMAERLESVGGSIRIQSAPGKGTTVILEAARKSSDRNQPHQPRTGGTAAEQKLLRGNGDTLE